MTEESHGNPAAHGDTTLICKAGAQNLKNCAAKRYGDSSGLFQIRYLQDSDSRSLMVDPETNIKRAAQKYHDSGWSPWVLSAKKAGINTTKGG